MQDSTLLEQLRNYTHHKHIKLTNSGDAAIFVALATAKKLNPREFILIPDQGGWFSYPIYPKYHGFAVKELKTGAGVIDLEDLKQHVSTASAILVSSFAGYIAEQPMQEIIAICHEHGCLVIEDVSGSIGDDILCDGQSDIIIGSFGKWKIVDVGHGGFISCAQDALDKDALRLAKQNIDLDLLQKKLEAAPKRLAALIAEATKVKADLKDLNIVHPDKRGVNVAIRFSSEEEKQRILDYCQKQSYEHTLCPRYIRVNEQAISIELKRKQF